MTRAFPLLTACVIVLAASVVPVRADQGCKPVVGHFEASVVPCPPGPSPICTAGRVWGGIQGTYDFVMTTIFFFTGRSTILLKSGDVLFGTDTGSIDLPPGQGGFASLITFDGGTGGTSGATGQIRLRGEFSATEGTTIGDYLGTLCTP